MKVEQTLFFSSTNSATADAGLFERQTEIHCCDWAKWTARTPLLDQNADRALAKSSRAFQIELSETLTPLPDVSGAGTLVAAVPVQRDRRSMSRRPGQNGRIEKRGGSFSLLFYRDVPGTTERERVRPTLQATTMVAARQEAQQIIDAESVNTAAHLEASRGPVGHGSDAMIKHYMAKRQSNNAIEIAKLQPVVRTQNNGCDGNEVVLLEPVGAILQGKKDGRKSRLILYNQVPTMGRSPVAQW